MAQVAQRRFIILNLFEAFFVKCIDSQDEHIVSFIGPGIASGFFVFVSKVWHNISSFYFYSTIETWPYCDACGLELGACVLVRRGLELEACGH
jgi:hypothetical protein